MSIQWLQNILEADVIFVLKKVIMVITAVNPNLIVPPGVIFVIITYTYMTKYSVDRPFVLTVS